MGVGREGVCGGVSGGVAFTSHPTLAGVLKAVFPTLVRWDVFNKVTLGVVRRRDLRWMGV